MATTAEAQRMEEVRRGTADWRKWGPYLSDRQWGTVREDYSPDGSAWNHLPHDHARSRAFRWGEDGIAGFSDDQQRLCLSVALWNGEDPILKERFFGLTNGEGNHGEDVKELYYQLDATPSHSYLKLLYKYPHAPFPYAALVEENRRRGKDAAEYELFDTGVFDDSRYFDVFIEYAKEDPESICLRITVHNRSGESAEIDVLPHIWFRNTWSWKENAKKPSLSLVSNGEVIARHPTLGSYRLVASGEPAWLFCENETNVRRLYGRTDQSGYFKDGINDFVVHGDRGAVNPANQGTKAAAHYRVTIPASAAKSFTLRMTPESLPAKSTDIDALFEKRISEADAFYADLQSSLDGADARLVQRQALAGMIWNKQFYYFDIPEWLGGDPAQPAPPSQRKHGRNRDWLHLNNADIISMPDKWEYPWYAAWDLAFHCIPLAMIDPEFAKDQLVLLTREWYMHPNGQLPAYEWAFGDVNPPVHAWATWRVFQMDRKQRRAAGEPSYAGDRAFLERVFHKLMLNFTWWVNRKDAQGRNIFQGGFLGLDNIGVFDRSAPLPTGGFINQADGTSWMAMYCLNLMRIALELALENPVYEDIATKFFEHFLHIAEAMNNIGDQGIGLWSEEDQFYYDVLNLPDGRAVPLKVRSMVGLIPLFAVETLEPELLDRLPEFKKRLEWFLNYRPDLAGLVSKWDVPGRGRRRLLSLLRGHRMKALLRRMLDENEFLSTYGVRSISRVHRDHPYTFHVNGHEMAVRYQPGESDSGAFGGNSNWRGPIWFPVNYLLIESLQKFHHYYGDEFKVECPTGSGSFVTIQDVADELSRRLTRIFLRDTDGRRPVLAAPAPESMDRYARLQQDAHFADYPLFYEYFDGDIGRGVGASHQCGWSGLVAKLLKPRDSQVLSARSAARPAVAGTPPRQSTAAENRTTKRVSS